MNYYKLGVEALKSYVKKKSRLANDRLLRIEKSGLHSYAYKSSMRTLNLEGRRRFRYGFESYYDLILEAKRIDRFLANPDSLVSQVRSRQKQAWGKLRLRYMKKGIDISEIGLDLSSFYNFLNSTEGKQLVKDYGSDDVVDDIIINIAKNDVKIDQVIEEFKEFQKHEISFEALELKRRGVIRDYGDYNKLKERIGIT